MPGCTLLESFPVVGMTTYSGGAKQAMAGNKCFSHPKVTSHHTIQYWGSRLGLLSLTACKYDAGSINNSQERKNIAWGLRVKKKSGKGKVQQFRE